MTQQTNTPPFNMPPFDPAAAQAMWQQMMSQFTQGAGQQTPPPGMPAEMFKQMQKAYLDTMGRWADEYMRSPQFLEQMKQSLEGALAMRRQVEEFIRKATEQSYGSTLGIYDAVGAVRDAESWITRRIDELGNRLSAIEETLGVETKSRRSTGGAKRTGKPAKKAPKKTSKKTSKKTAARATKPGKKTAKKSRR